MAKFFAMRQNGLLASSSGKYEHSTEDEVMETAKQNAKNGKVTVLKAITEVVPKADVDIVKLTD